MELQLLAFELAVIVVMTLVVGTFAPPLQDRLPWGRAWRRYWERRRSEQLRAIFDAERARERAEAPPVDAVDYRTNARVDVAEEEPSFLERRRARARALERLEIEAAAETADRAQERR